jgi:two-component system sensor histidine kinase DesK
MNIIRQIFSGPWVPPAAGRTPFLWISSLMFFLWRYFYIPPSMVELGWLVATIVFFVPLYFYSYWARGRQIAICLALTFVLGQLWAPYNSGACTFFIFACGMCGRIENKRNAYGTVAAIVAMASVIALQVEMPLSFMLPTLVVGAPIGIASIMDSSLRRSRDLLMRKQEEVEHMATIAERERISRDLHDLLGHTLSLITIKAELAGKLFDHDASASRREIKDIENSARHALNEVRAAVTGYRQTGFAHELATARASLAAAQVEMEASVQPFLMPPSAENVLALALREAVTNIVRHAGATRCSVSVTQEGGLIVFRIRDNGTASGANQTLHHGNGLRGMQERVAGLGGQLVLKLENGLALELRLPMAAGAGASK